MGLVFVTLISSFFAPPAPHDVFRWLERDGFSFTLKNVFPAQERAPALAGDS